MTLLPLWELAQISYPPKLKFPGICAPKARPMFSDTINLIYSLFSLFPK